MRWAQVVLDDADLAAPSILTGVPPFPDLNEGRWARALERLLPEPRFKPELRSRPRLLSLRRADVAGLTVASVDLRACRFAGAHHLDQLRVGEEASLGYTAGGWRWIVTTARNRAIDELRRSARGRGLHEQVARSQPLLRARALRSGERTDR